jgi:hypothetical protein
MPTFNEMAQILRNANPENQPMSLQWMAEQWWPEKTWLKLKPCHHNGGPRTGARVAGGMAGRLKKKGFLRMCGDDETMQRCYVLTNKVGEV